MPSHKLFVPYVRVLRRVSAGHGIGVARPLSAWQLRVEKLALEYHKPNHHGMTAVGPTGVSYDPEWFHRFEASLLHQATLISRAARNCGVRTVWLESDLLFPSLTMWDAMFAPHVPSTMESTLASYGVPALNRTTGASLLAGLLQKVLAILREGSTAATVGRKGGSIPDGRPAGSHRVSSGTLDAKGGAIEVVTMPALLGSTVGVSGHPLEPFTRTTGSRLLNLERSLLAVATLSQVSASDWEKTASPVRRTCASSPRSPAFTLTPHDTGGLARAHAARLHILRLGQRHPCRAARPQRRCLHDRQWLRLVPAALIELNK